MKRRVIPILQAGIASLVAVGAADLESAGSFVGGAIESRSVGIQAQGAFGVGFSSVEVRSTDSSVSGQSGPLAAIQNRPSVTEDRFNFVASLGDSLELTYTDIAFLSGVVEVDGESLSYRVTVNGGDLSQNGTSTAQVVLQAGQGFVWKLPATGDINALGLTVVGVDAVALSSGDSPLAVEEAGGITIAIKESGGSSVGGASASDLGNAAFPGGKVTEVYEITNTSTLTDSSVSLELLDEETKTWTPEEQLSGLVVLRQPPARSSGVTVNSIAVSGAASGDFAVGDVDLPLSLAPGESDTFTVTFQPQDHGNRVASVGLARPGYPQGFFEFSVNGFGNRQPNGSNDEITRPVDLEPIKIRVADLLFNDRDLDGDMVRFAGLVAPISAQGRTIEVLNDQWLVYYPGLPDEPQDDQFEYELSDGRGAFSTSVVTIREVDSNAQSGAIEATLVAGPGQPVSIQVRGVPGRRYQAQFTDQLNPPNTIWNDLGAPVGASPVNGSFQINDPQPPAGQRIYRIVEAPQQP